jgi:hypothetical protein
MRALQEPPAGPLLAGRRTRARESAGSSSSTGSRRHVTSPAASWKDMEVTGRNTLTFTATAGSAIRGGEGPLPLVERNAAFSREGGSVTKHPSGLGQRNGSEGQAGRCVTNTECRATLLVGRAGCRYDRRRREAFAPNQVQTVVAAQPMSASGSGMGRIPRDMQNGARPSGQGAARWGDGRSTPERKWPRSWPNFDQERGQGGEFA